MSPQTECVVHVPDSTNPASLMPCTAEILLKPKTSMNWFSQPLTKARDTGRASVDLLMLWFLIRKILLK